MRWRPPRSPPGHAPPGCLPTTSSRPRPRCSSTGWRRARTSRAALDPWRPGESPEEGRRGRRAGAYDGPDLERGRHQWGSGPGAGPPHRAPSPRRVLRVLTGFRLPGGAPSTCRPPAATSRGTRVRARLRGAGRAAGAASTRRSPRAAGAPGAHRREFWDPARDRPALLSPGTRVRFDVRRLTLLVRGSAPRSTRPGPGRSGVRPPRGPRSGALDAPASALANRLVGNGPLGRGCLEITLRGLGPDRRTRV